MNRVSCCLVASWVILLVGGSYAAPPQDQFQQHLNSGEFGPATRLATQFPEHQDGWLARIAQGTVLHPARFRRQRILFVEFRIPARSPCLQKASAVQLAGRPWRTLIRSLI